MHPAGRGPGTRLRHLDEGVFTHRVPSGRLAVRPDSPILPSADDEIVVDVMPAVGVSSANMKNPITKLKLVAPSDAPLQLPPEGPGSPVRNDMHYGRVNSPTHRTTSQ
jgi:hypothetical protein